MLIGKEKRTEMNNPAMFPFIKGHNSRKVKLDLCFVVISMVYKFHYIARGKLKLENGN